MKITKPSQLREGMKLKGKYAGLPISGYASKDDEGNWFILPHYMVMADSVFLRSFTDLESVEGIRAAKEGDVLIAADGREATILFCNEFVFLKSEWDGHNIASTSMFTYEEAEHFGWKLKDEPNPEADSATIGDLMENIKAEFDEFVEKVSKELEPID